jgi:hypothetical protein
MKEHFLTINTRLYLLQLIFFSFLALKAMDILKIVQKIMHNNVISLKFQDVVF